VRDKESNLFPVKAIIDTGCQTTSISQSLYNKIYVDSNRPLNVSVSTAGCETKLDVNTQYCSFVAYADTGDKLINLQAMVLDNVCTHTLTPVSKDTKKLLLERNITLSDSLILNIDTNREVCIDILIGGDFICRVLEFSKTIALTP